MFVCACVCTCVYVYKRERKGRGGNGELLIHMIFVTSLECVFILLHVVLYTLLHWCFFVNNEIHGNLTTNLIRWCLFFLSARSSVNIDDITAYKFNPKL